MDDENTTTEAGPINLMAAGHELPTIGRIVHVHDLESEPVPAIVTKVHNEQGTINVTAFGNHTNPTRLSSVPHRTYRTDGAAMWEWPPRH